MTSDRVAIPVIELLNTVSDTLPKDALNRQPIVDQIFHLLEILSSSQSSCTFALNGKWGSGKTFVLNMLERQLQEYRDGQKYLVFHYNCWQYDYYEEPLVAIISAMVDSFDNQSHILSSALRSTIYEKFVTITPLLKNIGTSFIKNKIGIDLSEIINIQEELAAAHESAKSTIADEHKYDQYYAFNKTLQHARKSLNELSPDQHVVIIVDELDRCLPTYAIKVLERLHHLFADLSNTTVILSIDKEQLDKTVSLTFGPKTDAQTYLQKFIDFEIPLDFGTISSGSFSEKYSSFLTFFEENDPNSSFSTDDFVSALFSNMGMRAQERLMTRIQTIHKILFSDTRRHFSFLCFELMWTVFSQHQDLMTHMPLFEDTRRFKMHKPELLPAFSAYVEHTWNIPLGRTTHFHDETPAFVFHGSLDIPQLLIWYLWQMYPQPSTYYQIHSNHPRFSEFEQYVADFKKMDEMLKIIK